MSARPLLEPGALARSNNPDVFDARENAPFESEIAASMAISLKRIADSLEKIGDRLPLQKSQISVQSPPYFVMVLDTQKEL